MNTGRRSRPTNEVDAPKFAYGRSNQAAAILTAELQIRRTNPRLPPIEDLRFVTGQGTFVDDLKFAGMLYMAVLQSPISHAQIRHVDINDALKLDGVRAILLGEEARRLSNPIPHTLKTKTSRYCVAKERVRYAGEPVAAVAAETPYLARDAADLINVDYESLPAIVSIEEALEGKTLVHDELGSNVAYHDIFNYSRDIDSALSRCDKVIEGKFRTGRHSGQALEPFACVCKYDTSRNRLQIWSNFMYPKNFTSGFNIPFPVKINPSDVNFTQELDIGASFGNKTNLVWMTICSLLSMKTGRPVKFVETRTEQGLAGDCHQDDRVHELRLGYDRDGTLKALKLKVIENIGAYPFIFTPATLLKPVSMLNGQYRIEDAYYDATAVLTNKAPVGAYRGFGAISATLPLEVAVSRIARQLGMDEAEIRYRNFIRPEEFPYVSPSGNIYDSGNYKTLLDSILHACKYQELKRECEEARLAGRLLGIGLATSVEPGGFSRISFDYSSDPNYSSSPESVVVRVDGKGRLFVGLPFPSAGQSHETFASQLFSELLGIDIESVKVYRLDSMASPPSLGPAGSRMAVMLSELVVMASQSITEKMRRVAAHLLNARFEDTLFENGRVIVMGSPDKTLSFNELAQIINERTHKLPPDIDSGLGFVVTHDFRPGVPTEDKRLHRYDTMASGANLALVEVDPETGMVSLLKYWVADDCGRVVNELVVEGQVIGGLEHGIEYALTAEFIHDSAGSLLNPTFMDYVLPTAADLPCIEVFHQETPSPHNTMGVKGTGEGGPVWAPPAVVNAIEDALRRSNKTIEKIPVNSEAIFRMISSRNVLP